MRAPSYAIDHHRSKPAQEPILHRTTKRLCFCEMLAAATTVPRSAALVRVPALADSDPTARSALHISVKRGQIDGLNGQGAFNIRRERQMVLHQGPFLRLECISKLISGNSNENSIETCDRFRVL